MNPQDIIEEVKKYPQKKVKLAIADIDGVLRGKVIHLDKFLSVASGGFGFCDVIFGWDINDKCYDNSKFTGWHSGYPDADAKIDLNTFRKVPWDHNIPFFLGDFIDKKGAPLEICPRQLLKKIKSRALQNGYNAVFSQEFEWFNFSESSKELHERGFRDPSPITEGMFGYSILRSGQNSDFFNALFDQMALFNIPIEGLHTETGPGVYEAAIMYSDILDAADRAILFKSSVKEIGHKFGILPSFMAKWHSGFPGCSGHLHQSLRDDSGKTNLFYDAKDPQKMSEIMKSYLAGLLYCLPHVLPMYAPTINSYKRLVEGMWAPTTLTWAVDNRTTTVRALPGSEKATRLELRVVGSDVNPYLAMSAALASGLYGIKKGLKLEIPETIGNGYANKENGVLPRNLYEATTQMESSEVAMELFGDTFVKHFTQTRHWEWREFAQAVTDWEMKRYFELV